MKMHLAVVSAVVTAVLGLALVGCGPGQDAVGGLEGTVTEKGGHPVAGMELVILGEDGEPTEVSARTDVKGRYRIEKPGPGTYDVAVYDREGERLAVQSVTVGGSGDSVLDITLPFEVTPTPRSVFGASLRGRQTLEELLRAQGE